MRKEIYAPRAPKQLYQFRFTFGNGSSVISTGYSQKEAIRKVIYQYGILFSAIIKKEIADSGKFVTFI